MPYAVTLPLDPLAAVHIQRMWRVLAEQTGADDAIRLGYVPHITLAVLPDTVPVTELEEAAFHGAENWASLSVILAGLGVFPGTPPVIWVAPVVTASLLANHASLLASIAPFTVDLHYHPGRWVPHVTLSRKGLPSAARGVEVVTPVWDGPIAARLERVELVRFRPVKVLRSATLRSS
jgi:2'-5' RNA ligase